jgi:hypothetical protein
MAYDTKLAGRIRKYLDAVPGIEITEKKMFRGLAFMVNDKMCVCASGNDLMCRFNPALQEALSGKAGFKPMVMKHKMYKGYCYVSPEGIKTKKNFEFWMNLCLEFNKISKSSKKK